MSQETEALLIAELGRVAELGKREPCAHEGYVRRNSCLVWSERHIAELVELFPEERISTSIISQFCVNTLRALIHGTMLRGADHDTSWGDSQLKSWRASYWRSRGVKECCVCAVQFHPADAHTFLIAGDEPGSPPFFFCEHHGSAAEALHGLSFSTGLIIERLGKQQAALRAEAAAASGKLDARDAELLSSSGQAP